MMFVVKCALYYFIILVTFFGVLGHHHNNHNTHPDTHHRGIQQNSLISTKELRKVSEEVFHKLPNSLYQFLSINYQGQRNSKDAKDEAPEPLISLPRDLFEAIPTIQLMRKLYDNYDINSLHAEHVTPEEDSEENNFIDALLTTDIMIYTMDFLASKGYFEKNLQSYKKVLKELWFQPYSRHNHTELGSSGFEHVFLVEKKRGNHITGLHNWIFFAIEEYDNRANYLGYITKKQLANKAAVLKFYLSYMDKIKLSSMFIGTPPEFDIALYTLCFYARPNKSCKILLGNEKVTLQTWVQHTKDGELIGSSYPKVYN